MTKQSLIFLKMVLNKVCSVLPAIQSFVKHLQVIFQFFFTFVLPSFNPGKFDYDLVVIGGGSGGLACSKEGEAAFYYHSM